MSGKKIYEYKVQPGEIVTDFKGRLVGAGKTALLHYSEYRKVKKSQPQEGEDGDNKTTE